MIRWSRSMATLCWKLLSPGERELCQFSARGKEAPEGGERGWEGHPPLSYRPRLSPSSSSDSGRMKPRSSRHCGERRRR